MESAAVLFSAFKEVTGAYKEKNKDTSVIRFLDKAIKAIDGAIKGMDVFLKKNGVDLGKAYSDSKESAKSLIEKARESLGKDQDGNSQSVFKGLKNKGSDIAGKMLGKFSGFRTSGTPPPEDGINLNTETEQDKDKSVLEKTAGTFDKLVEKVGLLVDNISTKGETDTNGDGVAEEGWVEKFKGRMGKRKKEVEEEKAALAARSKKGKKSGGPFGWIADKLMSLGGTIVGGLWSVSKFLSKGLLKGFGRATWWMTKQIGRSLGFLGKHLLRGFGGLLTKLIPGLSGGIASTLQKFVGKGLLGGAKAVGRGLLGAAARALPFAGTALGVIGRGAAMLLTGPVGWAVAAGTLIYGGYKLYKYLTRNDVSDDIYGKLTKLRLLTYGFGTQNKESFSKIFELEMMMKDNLTFNPQDYTLTIKQPDAEQIGKIMDLFGVTPEEKERTEVLNTWFSKRFIPAYHAYIKALYTVNSSAFIDDLEKLKPKDIESFLSKYSLPTKVHAVTTIPFFDSPVSTVTKEQIEASITDIRLENKTKLKDNELTPEQRVTREVAKAKTQEMTNNAVNKALNKAMPEIFPKATSTKGPMIFPMGKAPGEESEAKPDVPLMMKSAVSPTLGQVNKAGGALVPGDNSLPGITTKLKKEAIFNLDPNVLDLFTGMAKEYHTLTGKTIQVNEGFRSREEQQRLYNKYGPKRAAKPGSSLHEFGLAIDINSENTKELESLGLLRKYGFTAGVGGETWHIEPIGVSLDPNRSKTDLEYRQYAVKGSVGKGGGGYGLVKGSPMGKRDIGLQRKIFGGSIPEKSPEAVAQAPGIPPVGIMANTAAAPGTTGATTGAQPTTPGTVPSVPPLLAPVSTTVANSVTPSTPSPETIKSSSVVTDTGAEAEAKPSMDGLIKSATATGGYASSTMDLSKYGNMSAVDAIRQASLMSGVDEETLMTFGKLESSLKTGAANSASSASGLFQITGGTWKELVATHGPKYGIPPDADKNNPLYNALMAAEYAKSNLNRVKGHEKLGVSKDVALYLTHHFGPSGGQRVLKALASNPNADVRTAVSSDAYESNKVALQGQTVSSYISALNNKFAIAKNTSAEEYKPTGGTGGGYGGSVASSTPTVTGGGYGASTSPSTSSSEGGFMQASYSSSSVNVPATPPPTIASAAYDITRVESPASKSNYQSESVSPSFDTASMEGILTNQLTTLTQIATVLGAINDKIDIENLAKVFSGGVNQSQQPAPAQPRTATVPSSGVNMTRRTLTT